MNPYITFFPLLENINLSLDYEFPQNFLASAPEPKNINRSSHMLSPTIRLHNFVFFSTVFIVFVFFVCFAFYKYYNCSASGYYFQYIIYN